MQIKKLFFLSLLFSQVCGMQQVKNLFTKTPFQLSRAKHYVSSVTKKSKLFGAQKKQLTKPVMLTFGVAAAASTAYAQLTGLAFEANKAVYHKETTQQQASGLLTSIKEELLPSFQQLTLLLDEPEKLLNVVKKNSFWENSVQLNTLMSNSEQKKKLLSFLKTNYKSIFNASNSGCIVHGLVQNKSITTHEFNEYLSEVITHSVPFLLVSSVDWITPLSRFYKKNFMQNIPFCRRYFPHMNIEIIDLFHTGIATALECVDVDTAPFFLKQLSQCIFYVSDLSENEKSQKLLQALDPAFNKICSILDENQGFIDDPKINNLTIELEKLWKLSQHKDKKTPVVIRRYSQELGWHSELTRKLHHSYQYAKATFFGLRVFEEIKRDKKTISSKIINSMYKAKELFTEYNYSSNTAINTCLYNAHRQEKELIHDNYYVFYHGQSSQLLLYEQLATLLQQNMQTPSNFLLLHVRPAESVDKEKELREKIVNPNNHNFNRRPYVLFLNASLYGNLKNYGSHSPYYLHKNFNQNPLSIDLSKLFEQHGYLSLWKKYGDEINSLVKESNQLCKYGNLIQIAVPHSNVPNALFLSRVGAPIENALISADEGNNFNKKNNNVTSNSSEILKAYYNDPIKVKYAARDWSEETSERATIYKAGSDLFEFCAAMTYDEQGWLNPKSGIKIYVYSPGDQIKIAAYEAKRKKLFNHIAQDIKKLRQST